MTGRRYLTCRTCRFLVRTSPTQVALRCVRHCEMPGGSVTRCHVLPETPACPSHEGRCAK